ncbi:DUF6168 family protein [Lutibacter sp. B1]|uniref:DUF6168 family protein n=1 Tax=Lutibacter sp. B1 TaxID=2725996 RepID=UPI0014571600|nr:DUF6168 family protein [Lutibacter sp. B1]NLP57225.1 hypothetical protein [Lutibacter sp. B1]
MSKTIIGFCLKLLVVMSVVFSMHSLILYFLKLPLFANLIIPSYLINSILVTVIFIILFKLREKYNHLLGFIFMGSSFLKFAVFFIFFYPIFKEDGHISTLEATSFLVPYLVSLIIETFFLVKVLNNKI